MSISTEINKKLVTEMFNVYNNAEKIMLNKVTKRIKKGVTVPGWPEIKYKDITSLKNDIEKTLNNAQKLSKTKISEAVEQAYKAGVNSANKDFGLAPKLYKDIKVPFAIQRLILEQQNLISGTHTNILRTANDAYREIIAEASKSALIGVETRKQAAQYALNRFADAGIGTFVDKAGRIWALASYVEMATRTTIAHAAIQGHIDRQKELEQDLIIISDHDNECPICQPWENRILSISGKHKTYPSLQSVINAGLFHPNCKHTLTGYVEGLTKPRQKTAAEKAKDNEGYKITQQQRYNERTIRKWKKRQQVAITDQAKMQTATKIKHWQKQQRELINKNPFLRRKYRRESIKSAR